VDDLLGQALEWPAEERGERLRSACADDPVILGAVRQLLDAHLQAARFLEVPPLIPDEALRQLGGSAAAEDAQMVGDRVGRYRILGLLARGGMGSVYLAKRADGAFEHRVALKLLRRGLDTEDTLARFRTERQILADLEHPNISRLIDGGSTADGRPYLVMEYVAGLPITEYCDRQALDVDARLKLFATVCHAVQYAHAHGVLHRDLKPSNIFVDEDSRARLLDFGIARLLGGDAEAVHTRTGARLMTLHYASPEQVRGDDVAVASDVYQLGLLLYELLAGTRAYRVKGRSAGEIERVVCGEPVAPPSSRVPARRRRRLRGDLDAITLQALRKEPERRYQSAEALALDIERHLEGKAVAARSAGRGYRLRYHLRRHRAGWLASAGGAAIILIALAGLPELRPPPVRTTPGAVAVLPFRISAADASLGYLREGMVDLLSRKLTGTGGPRSIDPSTVLERWRGAGGTADRDLSQPDALRLASRIGAERLLFGDVVGTPASMIVNATLLTVPDGEVIAQGTVQGPADSLLSVVDQLTARLLVSGAGEDPRSIDAITSHSLPAIRAYLEGRVYFRAARYEKAYDRFAEALNYDSTFALAAIDAYRTAWFSPRSGSERMLQAAWLGRDRLGEFDRMLVAATLGPDYPAPFPQIERLYAWQRLAEKSPDRVEHLYSYADRIYHWHAQLGVRDGRVRAAAEFRRALEADSAFGPTYQHLVPLLYSLGKDEEATRLARAYLRREPAGGVRGFLTWRMAAAWGDSAELAAIRGAMNRLPDGELLQIHRTAVQDGVEIEDAERALAILRSRGVDPSIRRRILRADYILRLARGRPAGAAAVAERLREAQLGELDFPRLETMNALALSALYGDGALAAAEQALERLTASAFGPANMPSDEARLPDLCTVSQWRLWNGERRGVAAAVRRLRTADNRGLLKDTGPLCARLLVAIEKSLWEEPDAARAVAALDSLLATGPHALFAEVVVPATLAVGRLHERLGDPAAALTAVRRRVYDFDSSNLLLAVSLRVEGRLAAQVGDTAGAIRAYRHYLGLRSDPEPALQPQADSVRTALALLERR
jgi:tRNA A-37 threonylcarbamoyl transferase component Bud32/tetratricopeptide (TPR) repeat protein